MRAQRLVVAAALAVALAGTTGCGGASAEATAPVPQGRNLDGTRAVSWGEPIDVAGLTGRIVFDDFDDLYTARADGSDVRLLAKRPGPEFDGAWAPDGARIVYRDSRREPGRR